jgi:hypothetical protein
MSPRLERQHPGPQSGLVRRPEPIRTAAQNPAEAPPVTAPDPSPPVRAAPPRAAAADRDAGLDAETLNRWRWQLGASARKAAASRDRAEAATKAWERVAAEAIQAGVPARLVTAAAADAGIEAPA